MKILVLMMDNLTGLILLLLGNFSIQHIYINNTNYLASVLDYSTFLKTCSTQNKPNTLSLKIINFYPGCHFHCNANLQICISYMKLHGFWLPLISVLMCTCWMF